MSAQIGFKNIR